MKIIIILLVILVGFLISILLLYKKDLRKIKKELKDINDKKLDNTKIRSNSRDRDIEELLFEINKSLDGRQKTSIDYINKEKEIKETIASLSHDLRTPLTSIKGYVDLLLNRELASKEIEYLNIIKSRSKTLEDLVSSFYELSKLELKEYDYNLEYINIKEILTEVIVSFYDEFKLANLEPIVELGEGDFMIIGDRNSMERIFINLIDNGIKYSKDYFKVILSSNDKIRINFINATDYLEDKDIEKIFNRFFIMDTSRQSESTGLGLYITRKMIEDMGYSIEARLKDKNIDIEISF